MGLFLEFARSTDLYRQLCSVAATEDGNLLERTRDEVGEAQTEFLRWALHLANPSVLLETGTNKGFFGYLLSLLLRNATLHTFDIQPAAAQAVRLLNEHQENVACIFYEGDTRTTLRNLQVGAGFAWLDGGHANDVVLSDMLQCYRLRVPYVAVDDTAYPAVYKAVNYLLDHLPYTVIPNPFKKYDTRGAMLFRLESSP